MNITPDLLTANGWTLKNSLLIRRAVFIKSICPVAYVIIDFKETIPDIGLWVHGARLSVPAVRTMESLSLLFTLLSDAPLDNALINRVAKEMF